MRHDPPHRTRWGVKAQAAEADNEGMDLSKVLGDVYESEDRPAPAAGAAPEWADEHRLDAVFAQWTPGPPASAPAMEREMAAHAPRLAAGTRLDDDLAVALTQVLSVESAPSADPVPVFPAVAPENDSIAAVLYAELAPEAMAQPASPAAPARWARGDDDIAFGGSGGSARRSRRSHR